MAPGPSKEAQKRPRKAQAGGTGWQWKKQQKSTAFISAYTITPLLPSRCTPKYSGPPLSLHPFTRHNICSKETDLLPLGHQNKSHILLEMVPAGALQATLLCLIQRPRGSIPDFRCEYEYTSRNLQDVGEGTRNQKSKANK